MIGPVGRDAFDACVPDLADLLAVTVDDGASVGFLAPFDPGEAARWWRGRAPAIADGSLLVWVARDSDRPGARIVGTVSVALARKPNSRHRGELIKLMVHPDARGAGLGRRLLATAEEASLHKGLALLLLDTQTASPAEFLYRSAGWTCYGVVPDYADDPAGNPRDCSFFYKRLGASSVDASMASPVAQSSSSPP